jgi:ATP-dependent Clp protease ATP-binding subunit ClpC
VIVFDEAEKANPHIWQSLLTLFDEGIVTEADGTRYDATGSLLVATSNLGYKEAVQAFRLLEIEPEDAEALRPQVEQFIWNKITGYFSPEFLGRFGRENIVLFNHFGKPDYRAILANQLAALWAEMQGRGLEVTVDEAVVDRLVEFAWERRNEGARTVRRIVTGYLRNPIVDGLEIDSGRRVFHFVLRDDGEVVTLER